MTENAQNGEPLRWTHWAALAFVAVICMASLAPFLRLLEFSNGGEHAVVASVQEIHRGGPWLMPTLHEERRVKKPPLATWVSALSARRETTRRFDEPPGEARDQTFRDFAWQVRWPALLAMGAVVVATGFLGSMVGGPRLGVVSAAVCGTCHFWLNSARMVTTDVHLALWVSVANCLLAGAVLRGWRAGALVAAGAALGLAMMSKGPVALLQSVAPVLAFVAWRRWWVRGYQRPETKRKLVWPIVTAVVVFAVVGMGWYVLVAWRHPDVLAEWKMELFREGATANEPSKWYNYATLVLLMFPWSFFLVAGLVSAVVTAAGRDARLRERSGQIALALFMLLVPVLVMSLFRDRKTRYLIPLLAPSSILAAWGVLEFLGTRGFRPPGAKWLMAVFHWLPLIVVAVGLPVAGAMGVNALRTVDGGPWYSLRFAIVMGEVMLVLIVAGFVVYLRRPLVGLVAGTGLMMLVWNATFNLGYRNFREGRSEMRPLAEHILRTRPEAKVYSFRPDRPHRHTPIDLPIYLNRAVEKLDDPSALSNTSGRRVYVIRQKGRTPIENPQTLAPRAGGRWEFLTSVPVDDATFYAFCSVP